MAKSATATNWFESLKSLDKYPTVQISSKLSARAVDLIAWFAIRRH